MALIALLDVNVLVALFDPNHVHHDLAHEWFDGQKPDGWATCPITENGFVRVLSSPKYSDAPHRPGSLVERLAQFCHSGHHTFWPDAVSLRSSDLFRAGDRGALLGHRQVTGTYLLGLATKMGGALATFDRSISIDAVRGARRSHLLRITPVDP